MRGMIKDSPHSESKDYDVIEQMEKEWEMTKEFGIFNDNNMGYSYINNMTMKGNISVGTQLQKRKLSYHLQVFGFVWMISYKVKTLLMNNRESRIKDEPLED